MHCALLESLVSWIWNDGSKQVQVRKTAISFQTQLQVTGWFKEIAWPYMDRKNWTLWHSRTVFYKLNPFSLINKCLILLDFNEQTMLLECSSEDL